MSSANTNFSNGERRHPNVRPTRAPWVLGALLLLTSWGAGLPPVYGQTSASPQVQSATAVGTDLQVELVGFCPLELVILSPGCGEVGRIPVTFDALSGWSGTVTIPNALDSVGTCGPQYTIVLADSSESSKEFPFRVETHCDSSQLCTYDIAPGVESVGVVPISPELDQAIESLASSEDLIGTLKAQHPALADEIDTYALDLGSLFDEYDREITEACTCQWTGVVHRESTTTTLTMKPRCQALGTGPELSWFAPDGQALVTLPALQACPSPDLETVEYQLQADPTSRAVLQGTARSTVTVPAIGVLWLEEGPDTAIDDTIDDGECGDDLAGAGAGTSLMDGSW